MANIPHFDMPFTFAPDGHALEVEQNSEREITNCVEAVIRTAIGFRSYVPNFGIEDPVFAAVPMNLAAIKTQVEANEPRSQTTGISDVDRLDQMINNITLEVAARGR